jgi:hypothetical protein
VFLDELLQTKSLIKLANQNSRAPSEVTCIPWKSTFNEAWVQPNVSTSRQAVDIRCCRSREATKGKKLAELALSSSLSFAPPSSHLFRSRNSSDNPTV